MFTLLNPRSGLPDYNEFKIFDSHVHFWGHRNVKDFLDYVKVFGVERILSLCNYKLKYKLKELDLDEKIIFAQYLSTQDFLEFKTEKLIKKIEEAYSHDIRVLKISFGPRLMMFTRKKTPYRIDDDRLESVYSLIEEYEMPIIIHVADPDIWYTKKYKNKNKYGIKNDRIDHFSNLLEKYPNIKMISAHLGSLPENLIKLGDLLDKYPQLFVDTASTRWMIRELGKNPIKTKDWINKYEDRILFGSDLSNIEFHPKFFFSRRRKEFYWASRYWSQRLFWETSHQTPLPFKDNDNPTRTFIKGLALNKTVLKKLYFENANKI